MIDGTYCTFRLHAIVVRGGWIAKVLGQIRIHRVEHGLVNGGGPIVVQIDALPIHDGDDNGFQLGLLMGDLSSRGSDPTSATIEGSSMRVSLPKRAPQNPTKTVDTVDHDRYGTFCT